MKYIAPILLGVVALAGCVNLDEVERWQTISPADYAKLSDADLDGVIIARDQCLQTNLGRAVNNSGCSSESTENLSREVKIYFQRNEAQLDEAEVYSLNSFISQLDPDLQWELVLQGHANQKGDEDFNKLLAQNRLETIAEVLKRGAGDRITAMDKQILEDSQSVSSIHKTSSKDKDNDGVLDTVDQCPDTSIKYAVDETGCVIIEERLVEFKLAVRFEHNSSNIDSSYVARIQRLVDFIDKYNVQNVTVYGHTSAVGSEKYNQWLSERRAESMIDILNKEYNMSLDKLGAVGRGESDLLMQEKSEQAHALNRRVEIGLSEVLKIEALREQPVESLSANRRISVVAFAKEERKDLRWHVHIMEQAEDEADRQESEAWGDWADTEASGW